MLLTSENGNEQEQNARNNKNSSGLDTMGIAQNQQKNKELKY